VRRQQLDVHRDAELALNARAQRMHDLFPAFFRADSALDLQNDPGRLVVFFGHEGNRIAGTDFRLGFRDVLDILRPDIAAANDDQIFLAAGDVQIAVQQIAQIAGVHPAGHLDLLLGFVVAEIAVHQAGAGNRDMTDLAFRQRLPGFAADLDAVAGQRSAAVDEGRDGAGLLAGRDRLALVLQNIAVDRVGLRAGARVGKAYRQGVLGQAVARHEGFAVEVDAAEVFAELAEQLHDTIVFYGDASDQELLAEEHVEQVDVFIAITNDDEANIMSAMLAKRMGAKKVMVLIQRRAYVDLVQGSVIDIAISPQQATISALLGHVRKADIVSVSSLRRGVAEAIEAIAHGDESTSKVVGRIVEDIKLPPGTTIGAIVRGDDVIIANGNSKIEQGDHVIMFITDKKFVPDVERLFQPSPFFL